MRLKPAQLWRKPSKTLSRPIQALSSDQHPRRLRDSSRFFGCKSWSNPHPKGFTPNFGRDENLRVWWSQSGGGYRSNEYALNTSRKATWQNVLLLNDPDNSLGEIQEAIQKAGYTAYMTDNSDDAIELFEKIEGKFCLLSLKAMGALDCLQIIQMFDDTVPIFLLGPVKRPLKTKGSQRAGGNGFFKMPLKLPEIWARLKNIGAGDPNAPLPDMPQAAPEAAPEPEPEVAAEPDAPEEIPRSIQPATNFSIARSSGSRSATEDRQQHQSLPRTAPRSRGLDHQLRPCGASCRRSKTLSRHRPKVHVVDIFADQEALAEQLAEIKAKEEGRSSRSGRSSASSRGSAASSTCTRAARQRQKAPAPEASTGATPAPAQRQHPPAPAASTCRSSASASASGSTCTEAATPAPGRAPAPAATPAPPAAAPAAAPAVPSSTRRRT